ncbi:PTS system protein [Klebsiella oxytoca]|nr:PTS system protein [Klebsiella oxytoca]
MIVGSFLLVFIFPPFSPDTTWGFARAWLQFSLDHRDALMLPFNFSMGVMTLFIAVGIAASLAKHHNLDSLTAGMLSLMSFLLVAAPLKDGQIFYRLLLRPGDLYRNSGGDLLYRAVRLSQTP